MTARKTIVSSDEVIEAPPVHRPRDPEHWWNQSLTHPLDEVAFRDAALNHYFLTSTDHHIRHTRRHAYHLLKILHGIELERELQVYREEQGL